MSSSDNFDFDAFFQFSSSGHPGSTADRNTGQIPTPPQSPPENLQAGGDFAGKEDNLNTNVTISVSTRFSPGAKLTDKTQDMTLESEDAVFFYVASEILLRSSNNRFGSLIPQHPMSGQIIHVPEQSTVLDVILHTLYNISVADHSPSVETLFTAVRKFSIYGIDPKSFTKNSMPLHTILLSYAPLHPIEVYTLAGSLDLYDLAVPTSSHLLSFQLSNLTDQMATDMGPVYLNRLVQLHLHRTQELKAMLLAPPRPHAETPVCDFQEQRRITRAWTLAAAYLAWDARPDMSTDSVQQALGSLARDMTCEDCKQGLRARVNDIVTKWSLLTRTI